MYLYTNLQIAVSICNPSVLAPGEMGHFPQSVMLYSEDGWDPAISVYILFIRCKCLHQLALLSFTT